MLGMATLWNAPRALGRQGLNIIGAVVEALAPVRTVAITLVRHTAALLINTVSAPATPLSERNAERGETGRDRLRQVINIILAIAQVVAIVWNSVAGTGPDARVRATFESPVFPAPYTFSVWLLIYAGALAYAVYQALPAQRTNALLRRIGWWTASAFLALTLWAVFQTIGWLWLTVVCIFWMLGALLAAFKTFTQDHTPRTRAEHYLVVLPLSIFLGYITAATIITMVLILPELGITLGLSSTTWSVGMLFVAGITASCLTLWSRGNGGFALTIVWALIGIVVQNVVNAPNMPTAIAAGSMALLVALALVRARTQPHQA